ncbi:Asp-tRNA(Asn)/Glu-tRNA(Gln) amidotransferase subunit GatB [bacterium]|nr:Asp-tRNA(Asn)/Glu-tRNA(Gln) amidotransferase subunit GatB [bacterium]
MTTEFETVIGLEVHVQLKTDSKIFAASGTTAGLAPNTLTDPVTLGLPGCLPVLNKRAVEYAIKLGLATNCSIAKQSIFARKHYLYPDLPKGYQISQYEEPICTKGSLEISVVDQKKTIGITRIHMEEDAGKNVHQDYSGYSIVDLNRAGVPLLEVVSEPDLRSSAEAGAYMRRLRQIVRYLDVSDGNMEEGSLRCDANVSVRLRGTKEFGTKVEIKNINSFKFVERAIDFEVARQIEAIKNNQAIVQETRLWDETKQETRTMRTKEYAQDYRYFPDPDLTPLVISDNWIERVRASLPELPTQVFTRLKTMYGIEDDLAEILTQERMVATYFDQAVAAHRNAPALANWITTELFGRLNKEGINFEDNPVSPENLAGLVRLIDEGIISGKIAKTVFDEMFLTGAAPNSIVDKKNLRQNSNVGEIEKTIDAILAANQENVSAYRSGKTKLFGFFVGEIMKQTQGKANPKVVNDILTAKLKG